MQFLFWTGCEDKKEAETNKLSTSKYTVYSKTCVGQDVNVDIFIIFSL